MDRQNTLLDKGLLHYKKDELEESKKVLQQVLKDDPQNLKALFFLGKIGLEEQDLASAINHLSAAEKLNPEDVNVLNYFGLALLQVCQQNEFMESKSNKNNNNVHTNNSYESLCIEADKKFSKVLKHNPNNTEVMVNAAFCKEYREKKYTNTKNYAGLSENPKELRTAKDIWFNLCLSEKAGHLASDKIRQCPSEEGDEEYFKILEYERLYQNRPELLDKAKKDFSKEYHSYVESGFAEVKDFKKFKDLGMSYLPNRLKEKFESILRIYQDYEDKKPLEDIVWTYYKKGLDARDIEEVRNCLILLNWEVIPREIKKREVVIEDEYFQTGNKFKLLNQLKCLEKDFPKNLDIKIALQKLYSDEGKDLKAKEKLEEIVNISLEDSNIPTIKPLNKSKNDVWLIYSPFLSMALQPNALVLKKSKDDVSIRKEKKAIILLGKIMSNTHL